MDAQRAATAKACLHAAYEGTMAFPAIVGRLIEAGFDGYLVDYRAGTTTCYLPDGSSLVVTNPEPGKAVAAAFDAAGIAACIRWAQSGAPDYSYPAFCREVTRLGCAGYVVSFPGRRVVYVGRSAETHVEHFPDRPAATP